MINIKSIDGVAFDEIVSFLMTQTNEGAKVEIIYKYKGDDRMVSLSLSGVELNVEKNV